MVMLTFTSLPQHELRYVVKTQRMSRVCSVWARLLMSLTAAAFALRTVVTLWRQKPSGLALQLPYLVQLLVSLTAAVGHAVAATSIAKRTRLGQLAQVEEYKTLSWCCSMLGAMVWAMWTERSAFYLNTPLNVVLAQHGFQGFDHIRLKVVIPLYLVNLLCFAFMEVNCFLPTLTQPNPAGWKANLVMVGPQLAWDTLTCLLFGILLPLAITAKFEAQHRFALLQDCQLAPQKHMGKFWWAVYRAGSGTSLSRLSRPVRRLF